MFILSASIGTLVVVNVICACVALGVGFAAGVWFFGASPADSSSVAESEPKVTKSAIQANERALMASSRLKDLASGIACDVSTHAIVVDQLNGALTDFGGSSDSEVDANISEAIAKMMESNAKMQERLVVAEQQIEAQADEIQSHETEARTDSLTGLANRRAFDDELGRRVAEWQRKGTPVTLLIMDIDHFKKFNDTHGHPAGDEVLRQVGRKLNDATRDMDVPCRYGGEEFAVIMPDTVAEDAKVVAERVRIAIESSSIDFEGKVLKVTTSVGLAQVNGSDDAKLLLKRSDDALYKSKAVGRNCGHLHLGDRCIPITPGIEANDDPSKVQSDGAPVTTCLDSLPDRKLFESELARRVNESHRFGVPLSVMHLQIDEYDDIRQKYGSSVAHLTLDSVAQFVIHTLREMDLLARVDNGQFVAMLPGSSEIEAAQVGDRVDVALGNCSIPFGEHKLQLRVTHGIAEVEPNDSADALMERAKMDMLTAAGATQTVEA